jgi:hypothetical protein
MDTLGGVKSLTHRRKIVLHKILNLIYFSSKNHKKLVLRISVNDKAERVMGALTSTLICTSSSPEVPGMMVGGSSCHQHAAKHKIRCVFGTLSSKTTTYPSPLRGSCIYFKIIHTPISTASFYPHDINKSLQVTYLFKL